jgi:hypothetical protein
VRDVNFEQAETLELTPIMESSLIFFERPAYSFLDEDGVETQTSQDTVRVELFSDDFFEDHLIKAEFLFEGINTIKRAYEAKIDFIDDEDVLHHTFTLNIPESVDNSEVLNEETVIFEGSTLDALLMSTQMVLTLTLFNSNDGTVIDENTPGNLRFRSKGTFYLNIEPF